MWLLADITSWAMFLLGVVLLTVILLRRFYRYYGPRQKSTRTVTNSVANHRTPAARSLTDAPPEVLRWQVEMHETARDLKAELDSKMSALQALIGLVRDETARLEAAITRAHRLGVTGHGSLLDEVERLTSELTGDQESFDHDDQGAELTSGRLAELPCTSAQRSQIYLLADRGQSPAEISDAVGVTEGDVELLLAVRGRPDSYITHGRS